jgi:signal transduction histidine kinase
MIAPRTSLIIHTMAFTPQRLLALLRWLIVAAACLLEQYNMPFSVTWHTLILGGLLGEQTFILLVAWRQTHGDMARNLLILNLLFMSIATILMGHEATTIFWLYPLLLVEGTLLGSASFGYAFLLAVSGAYSVAYIAGTARPIWSVHDALLLVCELVLLSIVTIISTNTLAFWQAERQHIVQLSLLDELSLLLGDTRRLDDVLARWVELVPQALRVQACVIVLEEPGHERRIWANLGIDAGAIIDETQLISGKFNAGEHPHNIIARMPVGDLPFAAIYSLPLEVDDRAVGILSVARVTPEPFDGRDRLIFLSLARHAEQSLRNARLYQLEAQAATQSRELEHFKSEMLASVSHEFRLPLASISLASETLLGTKDPASTSEVEIRLLRNIQRSTQRLSGFVQDVLDVARIDANQLELRQQLGDFVALARGVYEMIEPQCQGKEQRLTFATYLPTAPVNGDLKRLEHVVSNLLTNAHQYTPAGGAISLTIAPTTLMNARDAVVLAVADNGPGILPDERATIFQRFSRGSTGLQRSAGLGLGLHIARSVVDMHGGHMWVTGNSMGGSTFWCVLPLQTADDVSDTPFDQSSLVPIVADRTYIVP